VKTRVVTPAALPEIVAALERGEPVALPTETVYGLAADALNPLACARIFEAKERPLWDPLIVHLPDVDWLGRLAIVSPAAQKLAATFWPGPLTLVLPRRPEVPDIVTAGQDTIAVRLSAHPIFNQIVNAFGRPLAAPSANRFGRISPTSADAVLKELDGRIELIVDGGPCAHGIESTIVLIENDHATILRHGPITAEQIAKLIPLRVSESEISTPGGMKSHYAPRTPLELGTFTDQPNAGLLAWEHSGEGFAQTEFLSRSLDLREAAANLYAAMRRLDESGVDLILAEPVPEAGLGVAIMERLRKAAARE